MSDRPRVDNGRAPQIGGKGKLDQSTEEGFLGGTRGAPEVNLLGLDGIPGDTVNVQAYPGGRTMTLEELAAEDNFPEVTGFYLTVGHRGHLPIRPMPMQTHVIRSDRIGTFAQNDGIAVTWDKALPADAQTLMVRVNEHSAGIRVSRNDFLKSLLFLKIIAKRFGMNVAYYQAPDDYQFDGELPGTPDMIIMGKDVVGETHKVVYWTANTIQSYRYDLPIAPLEAPQESP